MVRDNYVKPVILILLLFSYLQNHESKLHQRKKNLQSLFKFQHALCTIRGITTALPLGPNTPTSKYPEGRVVLAASHSAGLALTAHSFSLLSLHNTDDFAELSLINAHDGERIDDVCLDERGEMAFTTADEDNFVRVWRIIKEGGGVTGEWRFLFSTVQFLERCQFRPFRNG